MKRLIQTFVGTLFLFALSAHAQEEWRFALEEVEGSVQDAYAQEFKKRLAEKTDGQVNISIYPYGALGTSSQLTELVQNGSIQFAFASPGHLASVIPEVGVFTLHFVLSDDNQVNKEVLRDVEDFPLLQDAYQEAGLKLLSVIPEGWMTWTANKKLTKPEDFKGLKIRTMTSPVLLESYRAYGANPTPMPYSEVYSGLQLGMIDAQVNPIFAIQEMSFYEVQKAMTMGRHAQFIATVVTDPAFYEDLPDDLKTAVDETVTELHDFIFETQAEFNDKRLEMIKSNSDIEVVELSEEERAKFREMSMPARDKFVQQAGERGEKILNKMIEEVEKAESGSGSGSESGSQSSS